ncbi:MAG TPA: LPS export ABC transporter periplasmic protein LptC [Paracoccaceae bacterium]|nr:LPS export ABC transporter periplasmic protein LptC [Paracoccaceae bacterium]
MAPPPPRRDVTGYTRLVRSLKIVLPLLALALLSSIFLWPRETRFEGGLVYTSADLVALGEGLAVTGPRIAGATAAGEPFVVTAERAVPDGPDPEAVDLESVRAEFRQDGREITLAAAEGALRPKAQTLSLSGDVALDTSDGYRVRTERVEADLEEGELVAPGPVTAEGPSGSIAAGSFRARRVDAADAGGDPAALGALPPGDYLWFEGGVRVTWTPAPAR